MTPYPPPALAWQAMGESLLIGLLIGIQRESDKTERHAGLRDFIIIGLAAGLCGLLQQPWLTVATVAALIVLIGIFRFQHPERTGITTELAAVSTFLLAYLAAIPDIPSSAQISIGLTILLAIFLEAKQPLDDFLTQTITGEEYRGTLRFLALIFIIYPLLPDGAFGPYGFLMPKKIWIFVILVSCINYVGYFLEKFFGGEKGLLLTSVLGGLASTTAATSALSKEVAEEPERRGAYSQAVVLANAVQFPRVLALIVALSPEMAARSVLCFAAMTIAGLLAAWWFGRGEATTGTGHRIETRNPFQLIPALKFGALFAAMLLMTKWITSVYGSSGVIWASALGGSMDLDSVTISLTDLIKNGSATIAIAQWGVLIALVSNAVIKTIIAFTSHVPGFGRNLALGFTAMFAAGGLVLWLT